MTTSWTKMAGQVKRAVPLKASESILVPSPSAALVFGFYFRPHNDNGRGETVGTCTW
jgi:hypothetical protein